MSLRGWTMTSWKRVAMRSSWQRAGWLKRLWKQQMDSGGDASAHCQGPLRVRGLGQGDISRRGTGRKTAWLGGPSGPLSVRVGGGEHQQGGTGTQDSMIRRPRDSLDT